MKDVWVQQKCAFVLLLGSLFGTIPHGGKSYQPFKAKNLSFCCTKMVVQYVKKLILTLYDKVRVDKSKGALMFFTKSGYLD